MEYKYKNLMSPIRIGNLTIRNRYAMGAMAGHFGEDVEYWQAIGYLHDFD